MTYNAKVTGSPALSASPRGLPGYESGDKHERLQAGTNKPAGLGSDPRTAPRSASIRELQLSLQRQWRHKKGPDGYVLRPGHRGLPDNRGADDMGH